VNCVEVSDVLGRRPPLPGARIVDDFTRECLALIVDTSISGRRVARELDAMVAVRSKPPMIRQGQNPPNIERDIKDAMIHHQA
jgi:putative transposase